MNHDELGLACTNRQILRWSMLYPEEIDYLENKINRSFCICRRLDMYVHHVAHYLTVGSEK